MKNKKLDFLINQFKLTKEEAKKIASVCKTVSAEKYVVWLAKEYKKDNSVINEVQNLIFIFDWVRKENVDVLKYDFKGLMEGSKKWHNENFKIIQREHNRNATMNDGVIYRCKDGNHFFKLLLPQELDEEGKLMGNCIGGYGYKLKNESSILISLRDEKNLPHVDIEIDVNSSNSLQVLGKENKEPVQKYKNLILEYAFYALGVENEMDKEVLDLIVNNNGDSKTYKK